MKPEKCLFYEHPANFRYSQTGGGLVRGEGVLWIFFRFLAVKSFYGSEIKLRIMGLK